MTKSNTIGQLHYHGAKVASVFLLGSLLLLGACANSGQDRGLQRDIVTETDATNVDKRARIRYELAAGYFEQGKEDPRVQLIKVVPHGAEYWANGNAITSAVKMTAAAVTDTAIEKSLGENFSIEL